MTFLERELMASEVSKKMGDLKRRRVPIITVIIMEDESCKNGGQNTFTRAESEMQRESSDENRDEAE